VPHQLLKPPRRATLEPVGWKQPPDVYGVNKSLENEAVHGPVGNHLVSMPQHPARSPVCILIRRLNWLMSSPTSSTTFLPSPRASFHTTSYHSICFSICPDQKEPKSSGHLVQLLPNRNVLSLNFIHWSKSACHRGNSLVTCFHIHRGGFQATLRSDEPIAGGQPLKVPEVASGAMGFMCQQRAVTCMCTL
jgi:hypothetical protein